jgi:hypothetical protein
MWLVVPSKIEQQLVRLFVRAFRFWMLHFALEIFGALYLSCP